MASVKKFPTNTQLPVSIVEYVNADVYKLQADEAGRQFVFEKTDGTVQFQPNDMSGNAVLGNGVKAAFKLNADRYFSVPDSGTTKQVSKEEADKIQAAITAAQTAAVINKAAENAVKSETEKGINLKKILGITAIVGLIFGGIALICRKK